MAHDPVRIARSRGRRVWDLRAFYSIIGSGQLGDGTTTDQLKPVTVLVLTGATFSPLTDVVASAAGNAHTCALRADSTVRCWGGNSFGQLGDGTTFTQLTPVAVSGVTIAVAITAGDSHTCALRDDGTAFCWGLNAFGQLGNGTTTGQEPQPIP